MSRTRLLMGGCVGVVTVLVLFMSSCKRELSTDAVSQARDLVGTVLLTPGNVAVDSALVILRLCDGTQLQVTMTNAAGEFTFSNVPIIPDGSCYRVSVQKDLYEPKDTSVNCNCNKLQVGIVFLKMQSSYCELEAKPDSIVFGSLLPGSVRDSSCRIRNLGPTEVGIRVIYLRSTGSVTGSRGFSLDISGTNIASPVRPYGADTRIVGVHFTHTSPGAYRDTVTVEKTCGAAPELVILSARVATCTLSVSPATLNFGTLEYGYRDSTQTVTIRNPSPMAATIDSIWWEGDTSYTINKTGALPSLAPGAFMTITLTAHPNVPGTRQGRVVVRSSCGADQYCTATVAVQQPTCHVVRDSTWDPLIPAGDIDSATYRIVNASSIARLRIDSVAVVTTAPSSTPNVFSCTVLQAEPPYWVDPNVWITVRVYFRPAALAQYSGELQVFSNSQSSCNASLTGSSTDPPGTYPGVLLRWSPFTSSQFLYKGWRFVTCRAEPDSNNYCGVAEGSNLEPLPQGDFGLDTADFQFNGYTQHLGYKEISIHAINGVYLLDAAGDTFPLTDSRYHNLRESDFTSNATRGCSVTFHENDVLAIRQRESGRYALIYIKAATLNSEGIQELDFDTMYNLPLRSGRRR
jgi:hypothetical protein